MPDETAPGPGDLGRVLTVPNALSLSRILLSGYYLWALFGWTPFGPGDRVLATIVLAVAGTTDFADGFIARRYDQVTTLGKVLDPVADRVLLASAISSMIVYGAVPAWLAGAVLGREALVAGTVLVLAARGAPRIDVSFTGKAATFALMVCFPLLLLGHGPGSWARTVHGVAMVLVVPALALSYAAALSYVPVARRAMAAGRSPRGHDGDMSEREHDERPWGSYTVLDDEGRDHKVKRIVVLPGKRLSYQRHAQRAEHWFVVRGAGVVTLDGTLHRVAAGTAIDVPLGVAHRIENDGPDELVFIEVQHGEYFGEDDIVRLEDDFGRASAT